MHRIQEKKVVPAAVIQNAKHAVPLAKALLAGGLDVIEVTLRTDAAVECIRRISDALPEMLVGAGTILNVDQVNATAEAGAVFGVAPGLNEKVVQRAQETEMTFIPGVVTPSEIEHGLELGCLLQKFFPAAVSGGVEYLDAMAKPYAHTGVRFIPLGGVNAANAVDYLALPIVEAIGGSWLVKSDLIADENWDEVTRLTKEMMTVIHSLKDS